MAEHINHQERTDHFKNALTQCRNTAGIQGPPKLFWAQFLKTATLVAQARYSLVCILRPDTQNWIVAGLHPPKAQDLLKTPGLMTDVEQLCSNAQVQGDATGQIDIPPKGNPAGLEAIRLELQEEEPPAVAVFISENKNQTETSLPCTRLHAIAGIPLIYQLRQKLRQSRIDASRFSKVLDVALEINSQERYMAAAMAFCNEIAARYAFDRVSLGWATGGYIRVQAISHIEKFEKKMAVVQDLEKVMEESVCQDVEIIFPAPLENTSVMRHHDAFAKANQLRALATFPIRLNNKITGALTCERIDANPFDQETVSTISLICEQSARHLHDLKAGDRWFGARLAAGARKKLAGLIGVENTLAKAGGVLLALLVAVLIFTKVIFRIEAPFVIQADRVAYLPAAFDGYIDQVKVNVGDIVNQGAIMLTLDTRELLLEESNAVANQVRHDREAQKARASNYLSEMKISQALSAQARAQLKIVRYHLKNAQVRAPFAGVVVEGELEKMLGAPVRKGDVLFKLAKLDQTYVELDVDEKDIHYIRKNAAGQIVFISQPRFKYDVSVKRVDPVAVSKEEGNKFIVRCEFTQNPADWWRPGMSGIAKINAGKKSIAWIITRRTIDFFRLFLWW
ncbi:efflux RND transporter periplasmic adaptor subunit [uncultured Desulfobacter sp.]|uniref:efflux RND transporter periplasmic adaptor subunit n=1 Tax=uncultured Desulfobacter sp. TaxID=240139 RepID=UPI0029F5253F|nr:efflux RND transporter periplasmic adaptor subunit [uncultured Desulfobacter sp.]